MVYLMDRLNTQLTSPCAPNVWQVFQAAPIFFDRVLCAGCLITACNVVRITFVTVHIAQTSTHHYGTSNYMAFPTKGIFAG